MTPRAVRTVSDTPRGAWLCPTGMDRAPILAEQQGQPWSHERVTAEQYRHGRRCRRGRELAQPRIAHVPRPQEVRGEAVLCGGPAVLVGAEAIGEEHARGEGGALGQPRHD